MVEIAFMDRMNWQRAIVPLLLLQPDDFRDRVIVFSPMGSTRGS